MIIFYKIRWLVKSTFALEPKFHEDWSKNGHATRKNPKMDPKKRFFSQKKPRILNFSNKFLNPHIKPVILAFANISGH